MQSEGKRRGSEKEDSLEKEDIEVNEERSKEFMEIERKEKER